MYKIKTIKSVSKHVKITSKGKLLRHSSCHSHLLRKKNSKRKRSLRHINFVSTVDKPLMMAGLPYS